MDIFNRIWQDITHGENIDLYATIIIAIPLAVLTITGIAPQPLIAPLTLTILALIAVSLLVNRYKMEVMGKRIERSASGIQQSIDQEIKPAFQEIHSKLGKLWSAGVVGIHEQLPKESILQRIRHARKTVKFLGTMMEDNLISEDAFKLAAQNGSEIQILLVDPNSKVATERSMQLGLHKDHVKIKTLTRIKELSALSARNQIKIEVRIYDSAIPALYACICDEYALIGFYWRNNRVTETPMIEVEGIHSTPLGRLVEKEFTTIWNEAKVINLADT